ncbi:MAG: ATP-binding response regulator [Jatrophihabitans sp.]|uniref:ATP-binding response regulator n=1 Tax=Jatrophihabitans sp. TaxID=1932789 RepID=UPI003F80309D
MTVVVDRDARVVIIDDTPDMRMVLSLMLGRYEGVEVVGEAGDGLAGIDLVTRTKPDVVLLDLAMPTMSGLEALPRIKAAVPTCEVIVLSGFESQRMGLRALDAGAAAYVQKGAPADEVVAAVSGVLGRDLVRRPRPAKKPRSGPRPVQLPPGLVETTGTRVDALAATTVAGENSDQARAVARVAHELRNPALALNFLAEELSGLLRGDEPGPADAVVEAIARQAAMIDQLTNDLLTSAHARRGSLHVRPRPIDLAASIQDAVRSVPDARDHVLVECPPGVMLVADKVRLQQLLINLITNAFRYGRPPVVVGADVDASEIRVSVVDHGDGVPEWFRDKLFDEYSRADSYGGIGTGIGLYIVRAIAEAHGGRAWYEPRTPGTAFVVSFPRPAGDPLA